MIRIKTSPDQILKLWEKNFETLSYKNRQEFKSHPITLKLGNYGLLEIEAAMVLGHAQYLPSILKELKFYGRRPKIELIKKVRSVRQQEIAAKLPKLVAAKLPEFTPRRRELTPNPFVVKYDKYICAKFVTHGRRDECRCAVAA